MNRTNLTLISQPAWKVLIIDFVARCLGLLVKVEGIPIGSNRNFAGSLPAGNISNSSI